MIVLDEAESTPQRSPLAKQEAPPVTNATLIDTSGASQAFFVQSSPSREAELEASLEDSQHKNRELVALLHKSEAEKYEQ